LKERVNPLRFSAASTVVRFPKTRARPDERLQRSEFCLRRVKGMRCPAWSMQHVFLSPAGYVAAAQMYDVQRSGRNRGMDFRWNSQTRKKGEGGTLERYPRRLCTVSVNYAKGDSPCRLLVDLDVERRYLHVASDSRIALYSLDEFQREKGKCNRVSAAGGGAGGGLDLDLASLIRSEGGQPPLCDSVAFGDLGCCDSPIREQSDNSRNLEFEENSLENHRFCSANTRNPMDAVFLAYLTAASAAAFATKNERMDREEDGPQREERRETWRGRASKARTLESPMQHGCNCANLVYTAGSFQKNNGNPIP
ncbi:hypothetical protein ALC57_18604, partial [Trachymyrmex cornetzi]